jgi:pimeloyl-ACP methyl ester carboxylesterase
MSATGEVGSVGSALSAHARRLARRAAVAGASSALAAGLAAAAAATLFARRVVTPDAERPEDVEVIDVADGLVTLRASEETTLTGSYGIWQDRASTHARLGPMIDYDASAGTVLRPVRQIDSGKLRPGRGRWNPYYFAGTPSSALGLAHTDIQVPGEAGPLHGWLVPGASLSDGSGSGGVSGGWGSSPGGTWAILIHGRGATREECLRALPVLHRLGVTSLVASYRTTAGLPTVSVGRYHLGDREWQDVESAIVYAAEQGAGEIVLIGWSMGGAIAMQTVSRSWTAERVRGIVLDAPVLDWRDVLAHQARVNRVPSAVGRLGQSVLSHRSAWRLAGTDAPVDLDRLDWVSRAGELTHPVLLIHSDDDEFVPSGPSRRFAAARPDLVTYLSIDGARHCKEWNVDPDAWDAAVARFLLRL